MRIVRFIFRNWALKIGALLLAIILYVGMVALQSTQVWPGQVPITPVNQPANAFLIKPEIMPTVGSIRYIAPADVPVSKDSFSATIDLSGAKVDATASTLVRVQLTADDPRIQIIDYQPQQVSVTLDPIVTRIDPGQGRDWHPAGGAEPWPSDPERQLGRRHRALPPSSRTSSRPRPRFPSTPPASTSTKRSPWCPWTPAATPWRTSRSIRPRSRFPSRSAASCDPRPSRSRR